MNRPLDFENLADGIKADLFDGTSAQSQAVFLRLNLASLSQKVSIDIKKAEDEHAPFISGSLYEFRVLNPSSMALARSHHRGELWLGYKNIHLRVKAERERQTLLAWFHQFSGKRIWHRRRNTWSIFFASFLNIALSFASTIGAGLGAQILIDTFPATNKMTLLNLADRFHMEGKDERLACDNSPLTAYIDSMAADLGFKEIQIVPLPKSPQLQPIVLMANGQIGIATDTFSQLPFADIVIGSLALSLAEHQTKSLEKRHADWLLQTTATKTAQLRLTANSTNLFIGELIAKYRARARSEHNDLLAIKILERHGFDPQTLIVTLDYFSAVPDPSNIEQWLPIFLNANPPNKARLARLRSGLTTASFIPKSGAKQISTQEMRIIQAKIC